MNTDALRTHHSYSPNRFDWSLFLFIHKYLKISPRQKFWLFDGASMVGRTRITISGEGEWGTARECKSLCSDDLHSFCTAIFDEVRGTRYSRFSLETLQEPRSRNHRIERRSHLLGANLLKRMGFGVDQWPEHMAAIDAVWTDPENGSTLRIQEKTAVVQRRQNGLLVGLVGRKVANRSLRPYRSSEFDAVVVWLPEGHSLRSSHFYFFPGPILAQKGFLMDPRYNVLPRSRLILYPPGTRLSRQPRDEWANTHPGYFVDASDVVAARQKILQLWKSCFERS